MWKPAPSGSAQERGDALDPVVGRHQHQIGDGQDHRRQAEDVAVAQPGGEHHRRDDRSQGDRGAVVGLHEDQPAECTDDERDRQQRVLEVGDAVHAAVEHQRREEDRRHLGQLRRLDAKAAVPEPAPRPLDRIREEDADQHQRHDRQQRPDQLFVAVGAVVDTHHDGQHGDAEDRPQRLLAHERVGAVATGVGDDGRRRIHHHHADADQRQRRQEQPLVRLELPRHVPLPVTPCRAVRSHPLKSPHDGTETLPGREHHVRPLGVHMSRERSAVISQMGDWDTSLSGRKA